MKPLLSGLLLLSLGATITRADRHEDDRQDRGPRVIVFAAANFRGDALVLHPGDEIVDLSGWRFPGGARANDAISSIRVEGGAEITVFADSHFRGDALRLTEDAGNLTFRRMPRNGDNWNDRISSLRVGVQRRGPDRRPDPDQILRNAFRDLLGREPDLKGLGYLRSMITDQGWTEEMVRDNIRNGDEFKREGADRIVRQAFQDVLGRAPDARELERYRRDVLEKKWLGPEVRADLQRSYPARKQPDRR